MESTFLELKDISRDINVLQDPDEDDVKWMRRVVYSVCGRLTLAALWDCPEGETVSVQYIKQRCAQAMKAYSLLYPEIVSASDFGEHANDLVECIYGNYLEGGQFYHKRNRVSPPKYTCHTINGISFIKGLYATEDCYISGIGPYIVQNNDIVAKVASKDDVFQFNHPNGLLLDGLLKNAQWHEITGEITGTTVRKTNTLTDYVFLKTTPPFRPYWIKRPDRTSGISMMCHEGDGLGRKQYFLIDIRDDKILVSDLPEWINNNRCHVYLTTELLRRYGTLPPIRMEKLGTLTKVDIQYRLPPDEECFVRMYSWPYRFDGSDTAFHRVIASELHNGMQKILTSTGFEVVEEERA